MTLRATRKFDAALVHDFLYGLDPAIAVKQSNGRKLDQTSPEIAKLAGALNQITDRFLAWNDHNWDYDYELNGHPPGTNLALADHAHAKKLQAHLERTRALIEETVAQYDIQLSVHLLRRGALQRPVPHEEVTRLKEGRRTLADLAQAIKNVHATGLAYGHDVNTLNLKDWHGIVPLVMKALHEALPKGLGYSINAVARFLEKSIPKITGERPQLDTIADYLKPKRTSGPRAVRR